MTTSRARLETVSGRREDITVVSAAQDSRGTWRFTLHLDDLALEDLTSSPSHHVALDLRDGRRFMVVCDGIHLADRTAMFSTREPFPGAVPARPEDTSEIGKSEVLAGGHPSR